jgi:hypothetical protein
VSKKRACHRACMPLLQIRDPWLLFINPWHGSFWHRVGNKFTIGPCSRFDSSIYAPGTDQRKNMGAAMHVEINCCDWAWNKTTLVANAMQARSLAWAEWRCTGCTGATSCGDGRLLPDLSCSRASLYAVQFELLISTKIKYTWFRLHSLGYTKGNTIRIAPLQKIRQQTWFRLHLPIVLNFSKTESKTNRIQII